MIENQYNLTQQPKPRERNQVTWENYRHEVRLQIFLPLAIGVIIVIVLAVLVALGSYVQVSQWADVALIWLVAPLLVVTLLFLVIIIAIAYGLARLLQVLPFYTRQVQDYFVLARDQVSAITDRLVEPILNYESRKASWRAFRRNLRRE